MTDAELLIECKKGLGIPVSSTAQDNVLLQKLKAIKYYMTEAGVSDEILESDLAIGTIVLGVTDIWNLDGGSVKSSPIFNSFVCQLTTKSTMLTMLSSDPTDGKIDVSISVNPILVFNKRIYTYNITLVKISTMGDVSITFSKNITGKILTIIPDNDLESGTEYEISITKITDILGQSIQYATISFMTGG